MNKLIRTALATVTLAVSAFGLATPHASAAVSDLRVSPSADCSRSNNIDVTINLSHSTSGGKWVAVRATFYKWNGKGWTATSSTKWNVQNVPAMGVPVQFNGVPASPGYYYVGAETFTWNGNSWVNGTTTWVNSYTVARNGGGTYQDPYCVVKDLRYTPF